MISLVFFVFLLFIIIVERVFPLFFFLATIAFFGVTYMLYCGSKTYKLSKRETVAAILTFALLVCFYFYWSYFLVEK